MLYSLLIKP